MGPPAEIKNLGWHGTPLITDLEDGFYFFRLKL
jgi:hypothetical protein